LASPLIDVSSASIHPLVERAKQGLRSADAAIRRNDTEAPNSVVAALETLQRDLAAWSSSAMTEPTRTAATHFLAQELEPYLARSPLVAALLRRQESLGRDSGVAKAMGGANDRVVEGLGGLLESWVRKLPGVAVFSHSNDALVQICLGEELSQGSKIVVVGTGMVHVTRDLLEKLAGCSALSGTTITVIGEHGDAAAQLAKLGRSRNPEQSWKSLEWAFAQTESSPLPEDLGPADLVLLPHLLEFLPARHAVHGLGRLRRVLTLGGHLLASTLAPGKDAVFLDTVLRWPTIRRPRPQLLDIFLAAELAIVNEADCPDPGIVVAAKALAHMEG
jgi:hypothetical protein